MNPVFIIGWDGATWDLIKPWIAEGKLPQIARLIEEGASGPLRSTLPPMTFPAWSSFMTGVNPGKHGIFDFMRSTPGKYELEFVNGGQRKAPSFWQLLSEAGRKVISISVPCTFPPEKVNGSMISGFDAPGLGGSGSRVDARGMYPPELYEELDEAVGGHPVGSFPMSEINAGRPEVAIEKIIQAVREKAATTKHMMTSHEWDCCMILFGESDGVGHHFWKYCDPESPLYAESSNLRDSIYRIYEELDNQIGELRELLPENSRILMMSDHGFGGVSNWVLYPNRWLQQQEMLGFKGGMSQGYSRLLDAVKLRAVAFLPARVKRLIYRILRGKIGSIESSVRYAMIDWDRTKAFFEENPYYPVLRVNLKGREANGVVEPGEEYEKVRDQLIEQLEEWRHPDTGERIVEKAYRREEVYSGACLEEAADIIVHWAEKEGYTYAFKVSSKSKEGTWTEAIDPNKPEGMAFFTGKSGSHRDDGIFLAHGPGIVQGKEVDDAQIIDFAPTILHMLDVPTPEHMDGRMLAGIFTEATEEVFSSHSGTRSATDDDGNYSDEDQKKIAERLRALGYID